MNRQLLVVANGTNARLFTREIDGDPVVPLDHLHRDDRPEAAAHHFGRRQRDGRSAAVPLSPHTDTRIKEQASFAHIVAKRIDEALAAGQCHRLVVVASNPFLGALRKALSRGAKAAMVVSANVDLTPYPLNELEQRLAQALREQRTCS